MMGTYSVRNLAARIALVVGGLTRQLSCPTIVHALVILIFASGFTGTLCDLLTGRDHEHGKKHDNQPAYSVWWGFSHGDFSNIYPHTFIPADGLFTQAPDSFMMSPSPPTLQVMAHEHQRPEFETIDCGCLFRCVSWQLGLV